MKGWGRADRGGKKGWDGREMLEEDREMKRGRAREMREQLEASDKVGVRGLGGGERVDCMKVEADESRNAVGRRQEEQPMGAIGKEEFGGEEWHL